MKAIRIYPIRTVYESNVDIIGEVEECSIAQAEEYAVYAVEELQTHLADFTCRRAALHLATTLAEMLGVPLEDSHNLGEAP